MNLKNKILTNKKHYYGDNIIISVEEAACFAGAGEKAVKLVTADGDVFVRWDEIETKANKYAKAIFNHFSEESSENKEDKKLEDKILFVKEVEKRVKILEMLKKEGAMKIKKVGVELSNLIDQDLVKIKNMIISLTNEGHEVLREINSFSFEEETTEEVATKKEETTEINKSDKMTIEIKTIIKYDQESLDAYTDFEEGKQLFPKKEIIYEDRRGQITDKIEDLHISNSFKEALQNTDIHQCIFNAIPYSSEHKGMTFVFDLQTFLQGVENENLLKEWNKLKTVYGSDVELLEKGLVTPDLILKEYEEVYAIEKE